MTISAEQLSTFDFISLAADERTSGAEVLVLGTTVGVIVYSVGTEEDEAGFEYFLFEQAIHDAITPIYGLDCSQESGLFIACSASGLLLQSLNTVNWGLRESGVTEDLYDICWVSDALWFIVGSSGRIIKTENDGETWEAVVSGVSENLRRIVKSGTELCIVGDAGTILTSDDSGSTWTDRTAAGATATEGLDLNGATAFTFEGVDYWAVAGDETKFVRFERGTNVFELGSTDASFDVSSLTWAGTDPSFMLAVGSGAVTVSSTDGLTWAQQESGSTSPNLNAIKYLIDRFIAVGDSGKIAYSATGSGVRAWKTFKPVSEIYRSLAFASFGGYMNYFNTVEWQDGEWVHHPRRLRSAAPGTVNDFDEEFGAWFGDLPGDGEILYANGIEGGMVLAEQNQISLVVDGGSVQTPWRYIENYGEGLRAISNLATVNGAAFAICTDGLIYRADYNSVQRLQGFFDLTKFDDFNPGSERVTILFDPMTQKLIVFRPESPWTLFLVDDENGSVSTFELPVFSVDSTQWTPRAVYVTENQIAGIQVAYGTDDEAMSDLLTLEFVYDEDVTGFDDPDIAESQHHFSEIVTGCFRLGSLGRRGEIEEILVRTWCDPDADEDDRPSLIVGVKEEPDDEWKYGHKLSGTIAYDGAAGEVTGTDVAFSHRIAAGDGLEDTFTVPWLVEKITQAKIRVIATETWTSTTWTKDGARSITLPAALAAGSELWVWAIGKPHVRYEIGDWLELDDGRLVRLDEATHATLGTTSFDVTDYYGEGTLLPAHLFPVGDENGEGYLVFGLDHGFDQIMIRIIMAPWTTGIGAKVVGLELGIKQTGREMKDDKE